MSYLTAEEARVKLQEKLKAEQERGLTDTEEATLKHVLMLVSQNLKDRFLWVGRADDTSDKVIEKLRELKYNVEYSYREKKNLFFPSPIGEEQVKWVSITW